MPIVKTIRFKLANLITAVQVTNDGTVREF
jgi:hypothetical protein